MLERAITGLLEEAGMHQTSLELYAVLNPGRIAAIVRLLLASIGAARGGGRRQEQAAHFTAGVV